MLDNLKDLQASRLCKLGGASIDGELSGIMGLVQGFREGISPSSSYIANCSEFFKKCLNLMVNFYKVEIIHKDDLNDPLAVSKMFGQKALTWSFEGYKADLSKGNVVKTLKDVQPFRTYHWALSPEQTKFADSWISKLIGSHLSGFQAAIKDDVADDVPGGVGGGVKGVSGDGGGVGGVAKKLKTESSASSSSKGLELAVPSIGDGGDYSKVSSSSTVTKSGVDVSNIMKFLKVGAKKS